MANVLVISGHPDPASFSTALAGAYARTAEAGGAQVSRLHLADLRFDPILHTGHGQEQAIEPDLLAARRALKEARHVVWFFPMWWGGPPALVKGFIDRAFTPGYAFRYRGRNQLPETLMAGRSARFVVSMDSPSPWYTLVNRRTLHASFGTATLSFVGFSPVKSTTLYQLRFMDEPARGRALEKVRRAARADLRRLSQRAGSGAVTRPPARSDARSETSTGRRPAGSA